MRKPLKSLSASWLKTSLKITTLLILLTLFHSPLLQLYGNWLSPSIANPTADIAVALGDGPRFATAVKLLVEHKVRLLYIDALSQPAFQNLLTQYQLNPNQVLWGGCSVFTTFDQAIAFEHTLQTHRLNDRSIVLISDRYHLRRSHWVFQHVLGPNFHITTYAVPVPASNPQLPWWQNQTDRNWVSSETQKLLFYWIYYGLLGQRVSKDIPFQDVLRIKETRYDPQTLVHRCTGPN